MNAKSYISWVTGLLSVLALSAARAQEPAPWFARVWQSDEGLPENEVTGVAQASDGYLWVASLNGLARFDGLRFVSVPLPLPPSRTHSMIRALTISSGDQVWMALDGPMVARLGPHGTNLLTQFDGLPAGRPTSIAQSGDGAMWVGYSDGSACRIVGQSAKQRVTRFTAQEGLLGRGSCRVAADVTGQIWFTKAGQIGIFRAGLFQTLLSLPETSVRIGMARKGGVWICAGTRLLEYLPSLQLIECATLPEDGTQAGPSSILEDGTGAVWIGTFAQGLFRFDGKVVAGIQTSHSVILSLSEDREGNIWVGTGGGGLNRVRPRVLELYGEKSGQPFETVRSVCQDARGTLWATSKKGGVARWQGGAWQPFPGTEGWLGDPATCVVGDSGGRIWIGTEHGGGLHCWENDRHTTLRGSDGLAGEIVRTLLVDHSGNLWIGLESSNCLQRLRDGKLLTFRQPPGNQTIRTAVEDTAGIIWLGTADGLLLRVEGDQLVNETRRVLSPPKPIRSLYATPDGSLWIGYAGVGLGRLRAGHFCLIGPPQGLQEGHICAVMGDNAGALWLATSRGILQVQQADLDAFAAGRVKRVTSIAYGRDESLPSLQANYGYTPGTIRSRDGTIWFPMSTGLVAVHPERVSANRVPPPVNIESVAVDEQPGELPSAGKVLHLHPRHRKLELEYTAPSFIAPESVRFRYRLQGFEDQWVEAGTQRTVSYSRLPAGDYCFQVTACNNAGVWNENGASLRVAVQPFLWQTWWFRLALAVVFTLSTVALVRYVSFRRLQRELHRFEREAAVHKERARIAKDIHDDLGASLTQISLLGELAQHDLHTSEKASAHVEKLSTMARQGIRALDEIVWAVNPRNDTLAHLLDYLATFAVDFLGSAEIRCRIDFPVRPPACTFSSDVRHNLFLVVKEALHNVVKHAGASEVRLRANLTGSVLLLVIEDNGEGCPHEGDDPFADGLKNIRQRIAESGGECRLTSLPGAGTQISIQLPIPVG